MSEAAWRARPQWQKWRARISIAGESLHLGYYDTAEEAQEAYAEAVKAHLGEAYLKAEARP